MSAFAPSDTKPEVVRYLTKEEMAKLQQEHQERQSRPLKPSELRQYGLAPGGPDINQLGFTPRPGQAPIISSLATGQRVPTIEHDPGHCPPGTLTCIKENGEIKMVTVEVAAEKLRAKEQSLSDETDDLKRRLEREIKNMKRNKKGSRDRATELVKQVRRGRGVLR